MGLKETIENDFKQALKNRETLVVSTLRMLKSAIHNKEIEKRGERLSEEELIKIIAKQVQQHQDSIEQFARGKRQELVDKETKEKEILENYLPAQLSEKEIVEVVKRVIVQSKTGQQADFGQLMKQVMSELKGMADGKLVSRIVAACLGQEKK